MIRQRDRDNSNVDEKRNGNKNAKDGNASGSSSDADPAIGAKERTITGDRAKYREFCKRIQCNENVRDENKTKLSHNSIFTSKDFENGGR